MREAAHRVGRQAWQYADDALAPIARWLIGPGRIGWMRFVPSLPRAVRARHLSPRQPWAIQPPPLPEALRGRPGIERDVAEEDRIAAAQPLQDFTQLHHEAVRWLVRLQWRSVLPVAPRLVRSLRRVAAVNERQPTAAPPPADPDALADEVRRRARELGLSAVGFAAYDPRYTFAPNQGENVGDRVIVCVLEQSWETTQQIPSAASEQTALSAYGEVLEKAAQLAEWLQGQGYRAQSHDLQGHTIVIHYGVEAGLGQLGLNGQLLTRAAGSRCRITVIDTNAPVPPGRPADFGIDAICDACQVCVRRCPSGAITNKRQLHRGVRKAKIRTGRCLPVVAQANGCAVCMKVCPVQRYGLDAVVEEFERSGRILGKDSDELEGYDWPLDGRHYGPRERPRLTPAFISPPDLVLDLDRTVPLTTERDLF